MSSNRKLFADPAELKETVRRFWNGRPCDIRTASGEIGSRDFFQSLEEYRYRVESFIPAVVQFERWGGKRVLEIGCGLGTDTLQFLRAGAQVTALDLSERSVSLARQRAALFGFQVLFLHSDAENLPLPDESFDLVYSWGVLHHTPDTERALAEARRVLRPGGTALVMLYHRRSLRALQTYIIYGLLRGRPLTPVSELLARYHSESPGTKAYTRSEVRQMFQAFSRVAVKPILTPYDTRRRLYRWLRPFLPEAWGWFLVMEAVK